VAQQPIAIAGSKGLPVFRTPKHRTNNLRIAACYATCAQFAGATLCGGAATDHRKCNISANAVVMGNTAKIVGEM